MAEAPNIAQAMANVLADIPAVGKNSQAPPNMGGYAFRGIEDILAAVKPAMVNHGVFCSPHILDRQLSERSVGNGKTMYAVDLWVEWTFRGPAGDHLTADAWGQGTDMGDKATQKAMTSAFKSMLMQTFCIGDEATDSERHSVPDSKPSGRPLARRASTDRQQESRPPAAPAARVPSSWVRGMTLPAQEAGVKPGDLAGVAHTVSNGRADSLSGLYHDEVDAAEAAIEALIEAAEA